MRQIVRLWLKSNSSKKRSSSTHCQKDNCIQSSACNDYHLEGPMRTKRTALLACATVLLTFCALTYSGFAADSTRIRFILDWAFQGQQAVFTIPLDDGTYKKLNLDVTVDRGFGSGDSVAKVASGAYEIGLADLYSMVRFNGENPGSPLIAVMFVHDKSA